MTERRPPSGSNLHHLNKLLTEYAKREGGMPVARSRHAIGIVVLCSMMDRVRGTDGGHLFGPKGIGHPTPARAHRSGDD